MQPETAAITVPTSEFLCTLQVSMFRDPMYGFDFADISDESPQMRSIHAAILAEAPYTDEVGQIPDQGLNLHRKLRQLPSDLRDDLDPKINQNRDLWEKTALGILPIGQINGCALSKDREGNRLDHYLIAINSGLVLGCGTLADALAIEVLEDDLREYANDGSIAFQNAMERFLTPTAQVFERTRLLHSWPPNIEGSFAVRSGALMAIMLQFVVLHEFGYIISGDVDSPNGVKLITGNTPDVAYRRDREVAKKNWSCEFAADKYAIETLCDWKGNVQSCWPNMAQVYLFFSWLERIEQKLNRPLCPFHPPPRERKEAVLRRAFELSQSGPKEDYFKFIDGCIARWTHEQE